MGRLHRNPFGILKSTERPKILGINIKKHGMKENYRNNLSLHIQFLLFALHHFPDRVVEFTTYLRFMTKEQIIRIVQ